MRKVVKVAGFLTAAMLSCAAVAAYDPDINVLVERHGLEFLVSDAAIVKRAQLRVIRSKGLKTDVVDVINVGTHLLILIKNDDPVHVQLNQDRTKGNLKAQRQARLDSGDEVCNDPILGPLVNVGATVVYRNYDANLRFLFQYPLNKKYCKSIE